MKNTLKLLLMGGCVLGIVGCANLSSIHRKTSISKAGQTEFVDAKQRAVLVNPVFTYSTVNIPRPIKDIYGKTVGIVSDQVKVPAVTSYRICSEPSPDVFSAYAMSAAAEAAASNTGEDQSFSGAFGISTAETAATIERTQVINMLRESMFRTCERWMNGALSERQMNIQTARDQRMMVATLAIEQLTGVMKRKPTIISSQSVAAMGSQAEELAKRLVVAEKETKEAEEELKTKAKEKETADKNYGEKNVTPTKLPEGYSNKSCDILIANEADSSKVDSFAVKIAKANADLEKCKPLKQAKDDALKIVTNEEATVLAEKAKKTEAEGAYAELNKNIKPPAKGPCDILLDPASTDVQKKAVKPPATEDKCKSKNKIIKDAPSKITAAEGKVTAAKASATGPDTAYNEYNKVATVLPAEGVRKTCDILIDDTSTNVEKSIVGASPTKEECGTLKTKTKTAAGAETAAKETVETKTLEEKTIRKQLETQTSLFLSAQTSGTGGAGSDSSSKGRMEVVVDTVEKIALAAFSDDSEILFACSKELDKPDSEQNKAFRNTCREIMLTQFMINADARTGGKATSYLREANRRERLRPIITEVQTCLMDSTKANALDKTSKDRLKTEGFKYLPLLTSQMDALSSFLNDNDVFRDSLKAQCQ